jgi:phosphopantothenoylcysteine decarboxylase
LTTTARANFDDIYAGFSEKLAVSKNLNGAFVQELAEAAATLSAPLVDEKIETTITKDGKRKVEIVEIGKRVATLKKFVEKEAAKLKEAWKHWDELQNEYIELGIEVFGPEVFGEDAAGLKIRQKGYKREMELLELEHNARVGELDEEIEEFGSKILQKMKASEKVGHLVPFSTY